MIPTSPMSSACSRCSPRPFPNTGRGGERPETVRGMVWRTVLLFAWYVGVYVANIWYYLAGHGEYERASLAILSWFGVRWHDTWLGDWGGPIAWIVVLMFSSCAPLHVSTLLIVNGFTGRRCRPFCLLAALLMPVGVAGMLTEPVLKHADWGEDFPDMYPNIIPGLLTSMVCVALVAGLACANVRATRRRAVWHVVWRCSLRVCHCWVCLPLRVYRGLRRPPQHSA